MAYKTNARALRLGISHDWSFKAHGPTPHLHLDHKLMTYVANLVEHVVPQAPQRAKTKGRYTHRAAVGPGVQGRMVVLRSNDQVVLISYFYLNLEGAEEYQKRSMERNLSQLVWLLQQESGYRVTLKALNYYYYFWRLKLFTGRRGPRSLRSTLKKLMNRFPYVREERLAMSAQLHPLRRTRRALRRWRRQRYHARCFRPMVAAFMSNPFDGDLVARTVALELQILRVHHRRFIRYMRRFVGLGFRHWNRNGVLEGLRLEVRGRMTDFRRQVRRAQTKTYRWGSLKKSSLQVEASHCRYLAYNRYGVIGVSLTHQRHRTTAEQWEDRVGQSPLRSFGLRGLLEQLHAVRGTLLAADYGIGSVAYGRPQPRVVDPACSGGSNSSAALEVFNRRCYYPEKLSLHQRAAERPHRKLLLLRPLHYTYGEAFTNTRRFPLRRASLVPFQRRLQQLRQPLVERPRLPRSRRRQVIARQ